MIVAFAIIRRPLAVSEMVFTRLRQIAAVAMLINLFMYGSEVFTELYPGTLHASAMRHQLFGLEGHHALVPFAWTAMVLNLFATVVFVTRRLYRRLPVLVVASCAAVVGVWIEKGMTFLMAGFVPTPLGDVVDYRPSHIEILVSLGIWAVGALLFTFMLKATLPIEMRAAEPEAA
jgi:molybdopterin-containing oxidoreductase family membrane subunit